jgi:hypothetical protein
MVFREIRCIDKTVHMGGREKEDEESAKDEEEKEGAEERAVKEGREKVSWKERGHQGEEKGQVSLPRPALKKGRALQCFTSR